MLARRSTSIITSVLAFALGFLPAAAFAADELGAQGVAASIEVISPSADAYLQYNGRLFVGADEYRWGGASCGSRTLSNENVDALTRAVRDALLVTPRYQAGQGSAKCLVGYTIQKPAR